jgi:DNA-binding transcriptional regulator YhcF (GntR family)
MLSFVASHRTKFVPKDLVTAEEIQQAIINRIMSRQYAAGDRLPSVRDLAEELGSNRNTVNKAYQMLAEIGVIENSGRKGFRVNEIAGTLQRSEGELTAYFYQQAVNLAWQALAAGMTAEETIQHLTKAVTEVYELGGVSIAFYECNNHDSQEMGHYLSRALGIDVDCGILDDLYVNIENVTKQHDLIVTTFHHLSEVVEQLGSASERVVGIDTRITPETMLRVARLPKPRIALIATLQTTTNMLKHILYSYYPDRQIQAVTITDLDAVTAAARDCDHLVVTHTCADQVANHTGRTADVVVEFQIDEQSIQFLSRRIHEIQTRKTATLHSASQV